MHCGHRKCDTSVYQKGSNPVKFLHRLYYTCRTDCFGVGVCTAGSSFLVCTCILAAVFSELRAPICSHSLKSVARYMAAFRLWGFSSQSLVFTSPLQACCTKWSQKNVLRVSELNCRKAFMVNCLSTRPKSWADSLDALTRVLKAILAQPGSAAGTEVS